MALPGMWFYLTLLSVCLHGKPGMGILPVRLDTMPTFSCMQGSLVSPALLLCALKCLKLKWVLIQGLSICPKSIHARYSVILKLS